MSITASIMILFVLLARLFLKKISKKLSYALWAIVLFRLICPFSFTSSLSLLGNLGVLPAENGNIEYIQSVTYDEMDSPIELVQMTDVGDANVNLLPQQDFTTKEPIQENVTTPIQKSVDFRSIIQTSIPWIWILGIVGLWLFNGLSIRKLRIKLKKAVWERENIYACDHITTPFVLGMIKPKIYLPSNLRQKEKNYIIKHEQIHIKRFDHIIKILSFIVLSIHWFNPLVWIAFMLSEKDMEMSCDESVLKMLGNDIKKEYSFSLLSLATNRTIISGMPIAFGEGNTKTRVEHILYYKKPSFWIAIVAFIGVIILAISLMSNGNNQKSVTGIPFGETGYESINVDRQTYFAYSDEGIGHASAAGDNIQNITSVKDVEALYKLLTTSHKEVEDFNFARIHNFNGYVYNFGGEEDESTYYVYSNEAHYFVENKVHGRWEIEKEAYDKIAKMSIPPLTDQTESITAKILEVDMNNKILKVMRTNFSDYLPENFTIDCKNAELLKLRGIPIEFEEYSVGDHILLQYEVSEGTSDIILGISVEKKFDNWFTKEAGYYSFGSQDNNIYASNPAENGTVLISNEYLATSLKKMRDTAPAMVGYVKPIDSTSLNFRSNCKFRLYNLEGSVPYQEVDFKEYTENVINNEVFKDAYCSITLQDGSVSEANLYARYITDGCDFMGNTIFVDYKPFDIMKFELVHSYQSDISDVEGQEIILVYQGNIGDGDCGYVIVKDEKGNVIYVDFAHVSKVGWNNIYLGQSEGKDYLLKLQLDNKDANGRYAYQAFRLDKEGKSVILNGSSYSFDYLTSLAKDNSTFKIWCDNMEYYLENSKLLLGTQEGVIRTEPVCDIERYHYDSLTQK